MTNATGTQVDINSIKERVKSDIDHQENTTGYFNHQRACEDFCKKFGIDPESPAPKYAEGYLILSHTAAIPLLKGSIDRTKYANEILKNADTLFPVSNHEMHPFYQQIMGPIATIKEFPHFYPHLHTDIEDLINDYLMLKKTAYGLQLGGFVAYGTAGGVALKATGAGIQAGAKELGTAGLGKAIQSGAGAAAEAIAPILSGTATRSFVAVWIIGQLSAELVAQNMAEIKEELMIRWKSGKMTKEQFKRAFDSEEFPQKYFFPL